MVCSKIRVQTGLAVHQSDNVWVFLPAVWVWVPQATAFLGGVDASAQHLYTIARTPYLVVGFERYSNPYTILTIRATTTRSISV